jgi:hypothetical protein
MGKEIEASLLLQSLGYKITKIKNKENSVFVIRSKKTHAYTVRRHRASLESPMFSGWEYVEISLKNLKFKTISKTK